MQRLLQLMVVGLLALAGCATAPKAGHYPAQVGYLYTFRATDIEGEVVQTKTPVSRALIYVWVDEVDAAGNPGLRPYYTFTDLRGRFDVRPIRKAVGPDGTYPGARPVLHIVRKGYQKVVPIIKYGYQFAFWNG